MKCEAQYTKEVGGYLELERFRGTMLHDDSIKLNCGRNCLAYLILAKNIKKIAMPYWMCDSVFNTCTKYGVSIRYYHVDKSMRPEFEALEEGEWLYLMNYYGQIANDEIAAWKQKCDRVIVDNSQAYFQPPVEGVDTLYTCRKFFGVPDGAMLYTDKRMEFEPPVSESFEHIRHLAGRFERTASEFYADSVENNKRLAEQPIQKMSLLTENLLRAIDYQYVLERRNSNYRFLHSMLSQWNGLKPADVNGAFAYPLLIPNAQAVRKKLIAEKIYVPVLWPNVTDDCSEDTSDFKMSTDILPLPCDQRYDLNAMRWVADEVTKYMS